MSSFNILLFACAFYLVHGRPEPITSDENLQLDSDCAPALPRDKTYPHIEAGKYQEQVDGLLQDMVSAMDVHMLPLLSKLEEETQKELLTMAFDGFRSYLNYVLILIQEDEHKDSLENVPADEVLAEEEKMAESDELKPKFDSEFLAVAPNDDDQESLNEITSEEQSEEVSDTQADTTAPAETEPELDNEDGDYPTAEDTVDSAVTDY